MGNTAASFDTFKTTLFKLCDQGATGTLFIVTVDNHAAQVVLAAGRLAGIACKGLYHAAALAELAGMVRLRFSFTPDLIYPLEYPLAAGQSEVLLHGLGYAATAVTEGRPVATAGSAPQAVSPVRPLRIYRGRVIPD